MKYVAFLSYGKDSMAQLVKIKELGLPLDEVVYVDIRYTREVSAEHPLMADWIPTAEKILLDEFNIKVKHLTAHYTFKDYFYRIKQKGKHIGDRYGFPFIVGAWCNSRLKLDVIDKHISQQNDTVCEYIGIAYDEPTRYERLLKKSNNKIKYTSVLYDNKITEQQAFEICRKYNLISPIYNNGGYRGGCWFCVKQCMADIYDLYVNYPHLFNELLTLEKDSHNTFKPNLSLAQIKQKFDNGYIPKRKKSNNGGGGNGKPI